MKRAFVFSLDAIIVLGLVLMLTFFLLALSLTYSSPELRYQRLYYTGKDLLNVLEQAKLGSVQDNPVVQDYLSRGILIEDDMNKTILDVIGSLWAEGNITEARNLTNSAFAQILNGTSVDYQLLIDSQLISEKNTTVPTYLAKLSAIVSGYDIGKPVSGTSARIRISKANKVSSAYLYFGGYVGDGNITASFILPEYDNILNVSMEMNSGNNLSLYVNGNFAGTYIKNAQGNISADRWSIDPSYYQYFIPGANSIGINFVTNLSMFLGGGYIKVTYNTSQLAESPEEFGQNATRTESIPGIGGIINLYSSFFTPGTLKNMYAYLHYKSNFTVFMTVGNITVYEGNSSLEGEKSVTLDNAYLSGLLDYGSLSNRTTPFRIGLQNVSYLTIGIYGIGDPVLVTDVSGSMDDCAINDPPYVNPIWCMYNCISGGSKSCTLADASLCTGNPCGGSCVNPWNYHSCSKKITVAKDADKKFAAIILNDSTPGNRLGLVNYSTTIRGYLNFSTNKTLINNTIDSYGINQNTCICCGINRATNMSRDLSSSSRKRITVIMTDGIANQRCPVSENRATSDLNGDGAVNASDDAINASCMAYQKYGIIVYSVGFGANESVIDNVTLYKIAQCGNGKYYFSNATELATTFQQIALDVINASYVAQTVEVLGAGNITELYPDSYIRLNYSSSVQPAGYGEVMLTFESPNLSSMSGPENITDNVTQTKEGWYYIPEGLEVMDSKITSYSSNFWTDRLYVNSSVTGGWQRIYWLGDYGGTNYTSLGDPFIVNVPLSYVAPGNNSIKIGTGLNSTGNGTGASGDDRIIYTLKIDGIFLEEYSGVFPKGKGSTVTVYYDYNGDNAYDGYSQVAYGPDPSDIFDPWNDSVDDAFMNLMDMMNFIQDANPSSYGNGTVGNPYDGINQTNPVDLQITSDVTFDTVTAEGIPSLWGPAVMEIRIWS